MITLYPKPNFSLSLAGRPPAHATRNKEVLASQLTPQQVKVEARRLLAGGLPPRIWYALDLLAMGGVLSARQLDIPASTLRRWAHAGLFARLAYSAESVMAAMAEMGMQDGHPMLYTLGPIGVEVAAVRHGVMPATGYAGYTLMRVLHDVMVSEIVLRMAKEFAEQGWTVEWYGKYESTLSNKAGNVILEPDALLRLWNDKEDRAYVVEYHNEDKQSRAVEKVKRYEEAHEMGNWRERWEVETFPPVLAVFWHGIVGMGYTHATKNGRMKCSYYGKTLKALLEGKIQEWALTATMERRRVFE